MTVGDRNRVSVDPPYVAAIGQAAYCFATLEWNVVWCIEKIDPGYLETIEKERKPAGRIANELSDKANALDQAKTYRDSLIDASNDFKKIVKRRNEILHGKPHTTLEGTQALGGTAGSITISMMESAADDFVALSEVFNKLLYGALAAP